jgi:hypothetical protein
VDFLETDGEVERRWIYHNSAQPEFRKKSFVAMILSIPAWLLQEIGRERCLRDFATWS